MAAYFSVSLVGSAALWVLIVCHGAALYAAITSQYRVVQWLSMATLFCVLTAFGVLGLGFFYSDFSLYVVASYSHSLKPIFYKIAGLWAGAEGSLFLWIVLLELYLTAFILTRKPYDAISHTQARVSAAILHAVVLGFVLLLAFGAEPFALNQVVPDEGRGLNPLLQDVGLAIHPPMLFLGYAGFVVAFAMAGAYLLMKHTPTASELKHLYLWVIVPWSILTFGISLGSWWAYRELGWGGFWFWDPVENVSLLPWLSATALIHLMRVGITRHLWMRWAISLMLLTFICCLLGTFLVRSGVLVSVHSFANSGLFGLWLLGLVGMIAASALLLFGLRIQSIAESHNLQFFSLENAILLQAVFLLVLAATLLLGLLYPPILSHCCNQAIAVGAPYYAKVFGSIAALLLGLMLCIPLLSYGGKRQALLGHNSAIYLAAILMTGVGSYVLWYDLNGTSIQDGIYLALGLMLIFSQSLAWGKRYLWGKLREHKPIAFSYHMMALAHISIGIAILSIACFHMGKIEHEGVAEIGKPYRLGDYQFELKQVTYDYGKNYLYSKGEVHVMQPHTDRLDGILWPERRYFPVQEQFTSEASIMRDGMKELYVVLGEAKEKNQFQWRIYINPMVHILWCAILLLSSIGIWRLIYHGRT